MNSSRSFFILYSYLSNLLSWALIYFSLTCEVQLVRWLGLSIAVVNQMISSVLLSICMSIRRRDHKSINNGLTESLCNPRFHWDCQEQYRIIFCWGWKGYVVIIACLVRDDRKYKMFLFIMITFFSLIIFSVICWSENNRRCSETKVHFVLFQVRENQARYWRICL